MDVSLKPLTLPEKGEIYGLRVLGRAAPPNSSQRTLFPYTLRIHMVSTTLRSQPIVVWFVLVNVALDGAATAVEKKIWTIGSLEGPSCLSDYPPTQGSDTALNQY